MCLYGKGVDGEVVIVWWGDRGAGRRSELKV